MALIDGFPQKSVDVVKLLQPRLRPGAVVIADNVGFMKGDYRDYVDFMRDPRNGFTSMLIPFKFGSDYSVRTLTGPVGPQVVSTVSHLRADPAGKAI